MATSPAPVLLRLRDADIVRLCGLPAASSGLAIARHGRLRAMLCQDRRLSATVEHDDGGAEQASIEFASGTTSTTMSRWACTCSPPSAEAHTPATPFTSVRLACAHVAALLSAWIRDPSQFADALEPGTSAHAPSSLPSNDRAPAPRHVTARSPASNAPSVAARVSLHGALSQVSAQILQAIATSLGEHIASRDATQAECIERLSRTLTTPARLQRVLASLATHERSLLLAICLGEGIITAPELEAMQHRSPDGTPDVERTCLGLEHHGLLYSTSGTDGPGIMPSARYIPGDLLARLAPLLSVSTQSSALSSVQSSVQPGDSSGHTLRARSPVPQGPHVTHRASVRHLCALLSVLPFVAPLARQSMRSVSKKGEYVPALPASATDLPAIRGDLSESILNDWARRTHRPPGQVRLAWRLACVTPLATASSSSQLGDLARTPRSEWPFLLRAAFREWVEAESYAELADLSTREHGVRARCATSLRAIRPNTLAADNRAARRFIVGLVAHLAPDTWVPVQDVLAFIWWSHPYFLRQRQRAFARPTWWLEPGDPSTAPSPTTSIASHLPDDWLATDALYVLALLTGPLHWWGLLDLRFAAPASLVAIRLSPAGAFLLGSAETPPANVDRLFAYRFGPAVSPLGSSSLSIQPLAGASALLDHLQPWAEVSGLAGDRLLLRLSRDRVSRSLDLGLSTASLMEHLQSLDDRDGTHAALTIRRALATWYAEYGRTRISSDMVLLEAASEAVLREALAAAPTLAASCRTLDPLHALLPERIASQFAAILNRKGFVL